MRRLALALAFLASVAAAASAETKAPGIGGANSVTAGSCGSSNPVNCRPRGSAVRPRIADCHRDVRTHRIGGRMVRHRHVGENCAVREVRQGNAY